MPPTGRRRVGQGASSIVWYQPPAGEGTGAKGTITKQSKSLRQDQNLKNQGKIYQYLMTLPQSQRHIPTILEKGTTRGGRRYLSMSSEDPSLTRNLIAWVNDPLNEPRFRHDPEIPVRVGNQLLDAVYFLHRHNVVHGDIKPDNIIVDSHDHLKLIDFAYSQMMHSPAAQRRALKVRGTRAYMPPEFALIKERVTFSDIMAYDLWATGIVLLILAWLHYSNRRGGGTEAQDILWILQPIFRKSPILGLTNENQQLVHGIFRALFPRYDVDLFATISPERFIRLRPVQQQRQR